MASGCSSRQYLLLALRVTRVVDHRAGAVTAYPGVRPVAKGNPGVFVAATSISIRGPPIAIRGVARGFLDGLAKADEERAQDRDRAEDDDKPHFRQHPGVQRINGVGQVRLLCDKADSDGLVDTCDAGTVRAGSVSHTGVHTVREKILTSSHPP